MKRYLFPLAAIATQIVLLPQVKHLKPSQQPMPRRPFPKRAAKASMRTQDHPVAAKSGAKWASKASIRSKPSVATTQSDVFQRSTTALSRPRAATSKVSDALRRPSDVQREWDARMIRIVRSIVIN